jgi:hypothetical protein
MVNPPGRLPGKSAKENVRIRIYVRKANATYDSLTRDIVQESR